MAIARRKAKKKVTKKKVTKKRVVRKKAVRRRSSSIGRSRLSGEDRELLDEVLNIAVNDGDSYRSRRPSEAVDKAFEDYRTYQIEYLEDTFREIRRDAVMELQAYWRESRKG